MRRAQPAPGRRRGCAASRRSLPDEISRGCPAASRPRGIDRNWRRSPPNSKAWRRWWAGVHQEGQRHLEGLGHLEGVDGERRSRPHQRHHRRDVEAGHGGVDRQHADHVDMAGIQADLLFRLAQPVTHRIASRRATRPPGKLIWPAWSRRWSVRASAARSPGLVRHQRHQHRGGGSRRRRGAVAGQFRLASRSARRKATRAAPAAQTLGRHRRRCVGADHRHGRADQDERGRAMGSAWDSKTKPPLKAASCRSDPLCSGQLFLDAGRLAAALAQGTAWRGARRRGA